MKPPEAALYFDVTDVVEYAMVNTTVTGIQRSVLRILESVVRQSAGQLVYGLVKHPFTGMFKIVNLEFMRDPYSLRDFAMRFELPTGKALWLTRKLRRHRNAPLKRFLQRSWLQIQWAASRKLRTRIRALGEETKPSCLMDLQLIHGSTIVSLGAGWSTDYRGVTKLARSHGCKTAAFIHDIIAITAPHYTGMNAKKCLRFREWLDYISQHCDILLCNSTF